MIKGFFLAGIIFIGSVSCSKKDCSSIDLTKLNEIKLPDSIRTSAATLDVFVDEVDVYMANGHKLVMKCRTESDFENDKVLPGVMLWISDQWKLNDDQSKLGQIFFTRKIQSWERARIAGIIYHRHLNDIELKIDDLLAEGNIKTEYSGRILNLKVAQELSADQKQTLRAIIHQTDSTLSAAGSLELRLSYNQRQSRPSIS